MALLDLLQGVPAEAIDLYERACSEPLQAIPAGDPLLGRKAVEALLPHRDPFLFIDRVLSIGDGWTVAECDVDRHANVFAGHFPDVPRWPGLLQVEAITQAGLLEPLRKTSSEHRNEIALTHVYASRFMREVKPGGPIQIVARAFDDGFFIVVVGQILRDRKPCSAAIASCLW
jgi:3-hydroxyacyl-[acyl-carrier-protein] dehydratase